MSRYPSTRWSSRAVSALVLPALGALLACADDAPTSPAAASLGKGAGGSQKPATILFSGTQTGAAKIYVMNADGSNVRQLTTGDGSDLQPDYQPGGKRFAWMRFNSGKLSIWTANANGGGARELAPLADVGTAAFPKYSPDGKRIAFSFSPPSGHSRIRVMNADGSGVTTVTPLDRNYYNPTWSPSGSSLAFEGNSPAGVPSIYMMRLPAGEPQLVVECTVQPGCSDPEFNPAFDKLAFTDYAREQVGVMDAVTGAITYVGTNAQNPAWSGDGGWLMFDAARNGGRDIVAVLANDPAGSPLFPVTTLPGDETAAAPSR
jgi:dipeptidyl aminopeptidase/acylaminoacyl peptidase